MSHNFSEDRNSHQTVVQLYLNAAQTARNEKAAVFDAPDFNQYWSWGQLWKIASQQARLFQEMGLIAGDRVIIQSPSHWNWEVSQLALFMIGATVVGLDPNEHEQNFLGIQIKINAKLVLTDLDSVKNKWNNFLDIHPKYQIAIKKLINIEQAQSFLQNAKENFIPVTRPSDEAIIVFTSGTTSEPKGILYTHSKVFFALQQLTKAFPTSGKETKTVCWLPLSNLFQKMVNFRSVAIHAPIYYVNQPSEIISLLPKIRPDIFISVPRFYEKVYEAFDIQIKNFPKIIQWIFIIGSFFSTFYFNNKFKKEKNNFIYYPLKILITPWEFLFFKKFRNIFGGEIKYLVSGSAPMQKELLLKYYSMGMPILEAYGTSENIVPICTNTLNQHKLGSVGKPLINNSVTIAEDGEVLVNGFGLFEGYLKNNVQEESLNSPIVEYFNKDGYYHTGDLGFFDKDGFLFLHGRKSEVFKTTTGKKVIVGEIEAHFKKNSFIDQAVVVGKGRKFPLILLTLDLVSLSNKLNYQIDDVWNSNTGKLNSKFIKIIETEIQNSWQTLPLSVKPAGAILLTRKLSIEHEELTLNLKIKRKNIENRFQKAFDHIQLLAEKETGFVIEILNNEIPTNHNLVRANQISARSLLLIRTIFKVNMAQIAYFLGIYSKSQYYRKVGQFLRITFGQLKGPLHKLAQMMSHLSKDIPIEIREELNQLLHDSNPIDSNFIRSIIEKELGKPVEVLFQKFENIPLATGSIGQIHWAKLHNGDEVVVKVLIPQIKKMIASDLRILKLITPYIKRIINFESMDQQLDELTELFHNECDLKQEALNYEWFSKVHSEDDRIIVPKVYTEFVTSKILVTQYFDSLSLDEFLLRADNAEKNRIAEIIWTTASRSINLYASFNADPHAGNFLIHNDKVVLIDFGFCKKWSTHFIETWKKQVIAGCQLNYDEFEKLSRELGIIHKTNPHFYRELLNVYQASTYEPWLYDRIHTFNPDWLQRYLEAIYQSNIAVPDLILPKDFLALSRLYWGMFGIMANMNAEANFYRITTPFIEAPIRVDELKNMQKNSKN